MAVQYYSKNEWGYTETNLTTVLREYIRPAGKVVISESISIANKFSCSVGVKAKYVEAALGVTVEETNTFTISWENTYDYPVKLQVFPIYESKYGELWKKEKKKDEMMGTYIFHRALGDEILVFKHSGF